MPSMGLNVHLVDGTYERCHADRGDGSAPRLTCRIVIFRIFHQDLRGGS
jgi:hypothetical protein